MSRYLRTNTSSLGASRRAYSLAELLVVMAIAVLMLTLSLPAYRALQRTVSETSAEVDLRSALQIASSLAARSAPGQDVVAAFTFTPGGHMSVVTMRKAGTLVDEVGNSSQLIERDVFAPVEDIAPVEFSDGWWVLGLTPGNTIDGIEPRSFENDGSPVGAQAQNGWYDNSRYDGVINRNWLFPETGFVGVDAGDLGFDRQTYVVRFEGGTGRRSLDSLSTVLLVLPSESDEFRNISPWNMTEVRLDTSPNVELTVRRVLEDQMLFPLATAEDDKRDILGDIATDTVLAKPVSQLAIVEARRVVSELGATRLNRETRSLYRMDQTTPMPEIDTNLFPGVSTEDGVTALMNEWIEHSLTATGSNAKVESSARMFTVEAADGELVELFPS